MHLGRARYKYFPRMLLQSGYRIDRLINESFGGGYVSNAEEGKNLERAKMRYVH